MLQFASGVERVDVDDDQPCSQDAKNSHRILQQVRHHQCHAVTLLQAQSVLQIGGKVPRFLVQFTITHWRHQVDESRFIAILAHGFFKHFHQ